MHGLMSLSFCHSKQHLHNLPRLPAQRMRSVPGLALLVWIAKPLPSSERHFSLSKPASIVLMMWVVCLEVCLTPSSDDLLNRFIPLSLCLLTDDKGVRRGFKAPLCFSALSFLHRHCRWKVSPTNAKKLGGRVDSARHTLPSVESMAS